MKQNLIQLIIAAVLTLAGIGLLYLGAHPRYLPLKRSFDAARGIRTRG